MSMHPDVNIVLGIKVTSKLDVTKTPRTKYDPDTGKPYEVFDESYSRSKPE
jgi:hypothetical protein